MTDHPEDLDPIETKEWQEAISSRRTDLREDGYGKVRNGLTTLDEVLGVSVG